MTKRTTPVRGMRDLLPADTAVRDRLTELVLQTYAAWGFHRVETPALEHMDVLMGAHGGENETLIFKVMKRGAKLDLGPGADLDSLVDGGLRFDLTVPLARLVANNLHRLTFPFKVIQVGPVWRAERPQRGRYRQFTQCDIDILGVPGIEAEIELILATVDCFSRAGLSDFTLRISDRRLLERIVRSFGFTDSQVQPVFIALDKFDKIGAKGVLEELAEYDPFRAKELVAFVEGVRNGRRPPLDVVVEVGARDLIPLAQDLLEVVATAERCAPDLTVAFDPLLVRGMGYYTGQIFEISYHDYPGSIAGGGRYDRMIGELSGTDLTACGFSIGFERLTEILAKEGRSGELSGREGVVVFFERDDERSAAFASAVELKGKHEPVTVMRRHRRHGRQLDEAAADGYGWAYYLPTNGATTGTMKGIDRTAGRERDRRPGGREPRRMR